jgi:hypothetical protein
MSSRRPRKDLSANDLAVLLEKGQHYTWKSKNEERLWVGAAEKILEAHLLGKKTNLSEAAILAFSRAQGLLVETVERNLLTQFVLNEAESSEEAEKTNTEKYEKASEKKGFFGKIAQSLGKGLAWVASKLPGKKLKSRNWKILGGGGSKEDERYRKAKEEALSDAYGDVFGKELNKLVDKIEQDNYDPKNGAFPNMSGEGSGGKFKEAIYSLVNFALLARVATGAPAPEGVDMEASKNSPFIGTASASDANKLIRGVRKLLQSYDRDLEDRWIYVLESSSRNTLPTLKEVYLSEAPQEKDLGAAGTKTSSQDSLSMKGPAVLAALGAAGAAFGWLAGQEWFMDMFRSPEEWKNVYKTLKTVDTKGVTQELAILIGQPGGNISGMSVEDFMAKMAEHGLAGPSGPGGEFMPTDKLLKLAEEAGNPNFSDWWENNLIGKDKLTLAKAIPMSGAGAPGAGGDIGIASFVTKFVGRKLVKAAGLSAVGTTIQTIAPFAGGLGVGLLGGAAASALLRSYGAKNSRSSVIKAALDLLADAEVKDGDLPEPILAAAEPTESSPEAAPGTPEASAPDSTVENLPAAAATSGAAGSAAPAEVQQKKITQIKTGKNQRSFMAQLADPAGDLKGQKNRKALNDKIEKLKAQVADKLGLQPNDTNDKFIAAIKDLTQKKQNIKDVEAGLGGFVLESANNLSSASNESVLLTERWRMLAGISKNS